MTPRPILLDTHAAIWLTEPARFSATAKTELQLAQEDQTAVLISPISAWEVGLLVARNRLALAMAPANWFEALIASGLRWAPLTPDVLVQSSFLPGQIRGDPADRILAATARAFNYRLMTRDRSLLTYAEAGHLQAVAC